MLKKIFTLLPGMLFCSTTTLLQAAESGFIPRVSYAVSDYSFEQSERPDALNGSDFPGVDFDVTFNMLGVGGTFYYDKYYVDLYLQHSDKQSDTFHEYESGFEEKFKGDRKDYALTTGMKFLDNKAAIYAGYKIGVSEADGKQGTYLKFKEDGFFVGGNYGIPIKSYGVLTFNIALAYLNGKLKEDAAPSLDEFQLDIDADSNATGLSYGVSWSGVITDNLGYNLSLDANSYEFKDVKDNSAITPPPDKFEEDFVTAKISLSYYF